jgi:cytochrome d ubiquinol oxidase subunit II
MSIVDAVWFTMGAGVVAYALTGGADYGGGIWHLFARGPRAKEQQRLVEHAIAPIWEANHVWIIFVIVLLFTAFPKAFAVVSTALHVPIAIALAGIVLRGSAFVFHAYDPRARASSGPWAVVFGVSSLLVPLALGDVLGALSTGEIRWDGSRVTSGFTSGWPSAFAIATGVFAVALFALLAAVYLSAEAEGSLAEDFRRRALVMEAVAGTVALAVFVLAQGGAPELYERLSSSSWTLPVQFATAGAAVSTVTLVHRRRFRAARLTVALQVALVIIGWGLAMDGAIVMPDVTVDNAGAVPEVVRVLFVVLGAGAMLLAPALYYMFRVFKSSLPPRSP